MSSVTGETRGAFPNAPTPVMRQYREAKEQYPDGILLFRMGDFYEIFFEDAEIAAPVMGVTLTSRPLGKSGRAPMCGVPHHAWQVYVGKLLRAGHKVVICDQTEPAGKKGIVKRDVTRVLTPGTVVEDAYLDPSRPNYLVAAWTHGADAGLAACDVSTGELLLCQLPRERLAAELERLAPAELLTPPDVDEYKFDPVRGQQRLRDTLGIAFPESVGAADAPLAVGAAGVVLDYLKQNQNHVGPGSLTVRTYSPDATMPLDAATVRNLELPALTNLIDHTRTPIGARRLRAWLGAPMRDAESIELRLGAVDELTTSPTLRDRLGVALKEVGDLERLVSRAGQGRASARELEILHDLGTKVAALATALRATAQAIGSADAMMSLAVAAAELGWRRPEVNAGLRLSIKGGRHPLVEHSLPAGVFVANDLELDPDSEQVTILTGPNMAGKSTYLRQAAVIVLLAQCGSFVPAERAMVGLADRIFTRVGAHDDITAGMSTFMVEMTETSYILNHATRASLVILDEVGRGTSTYDGLSIAQSVVEHLHDSPRLGCRTLFATHYHELTALAERLPRVRNQRVEVLEEGEAVRFLHRVVPGGADRSYGIHVAALAGLPSGVIARARQVLAELERQRPLEPPEQQLGLPMEMTPDPLRKELEDIEPDSLSPLEALQKLYELRSRLGR